ncbi:hypothetical protein AN958_04548 [Leucoagaricus sp. SymC.cos]|nr:hypothetical protein AN958_04548 [Leucoagaricus sp. SymC.cos]
MMSQHSIQGLNSTTSASVSPDSYLRQAEEEDTNAQDNSFPLAVSELPGEDLNWDNDPDNARNWPLGKKWTCVCVGSLYAFCPILASTMIAPGLPVVALKYEITNPTVVALTLSILLLSYGIGVCLLAYVLCLNEQYLLTTVQPLVFGPLSEIYGRQWLFHIANILTMAFGLGCAFSPSTGSLVAFRFLSGFTGSAPIPLGGGLMTDLFSERDRGPPSSLFILGVLIGPIVGPVTGGFVTQQVGIKWVFIVISCLWFCLLGWDPVAQGNVCAHYTDGESSPFRFKYFVTNLGRPIVLLFRSFICFILSLYTALVYGIYYLLFSTFGDLFGETYGFGAGVGGLTYLGLGIGFATATIIGSKLGEAWYHPPQLAAKNGGVGKPEMRIPAMFVGSFFIPVGLFWYGWSAQAKLHWIMPIIGSGIFGFVFVPVQLYLVDTFTYSASAIAATATFRSLLGFAFPLFSVQMYDAMGEGGGNSMLAGIAIVLGIPFPIWIYFRGEQLRARNPLTAASVVPKSSVQKESV